MASVSFPPLLPPFLCVICPILRFPLMSLLIQDADKRDGAALIGLVSDRVNRAPSSDPIQAVKQTR